VSIEAMPKDRAPSYTPAPDLPTDPVLRKRYDEVMAVLAKEQTMAGAARSLDLSRNHFQTMLHRALQAIIDAITPKSAGRPARPAREVELEAENAKLRAENATLTERTQMVERLLELVGGIASGREPLGRRPKKSAANKDEEPEPGGEDPMTKVCEANAPITLRARAIGASVSTVKRRRKRTATKLAASHRVRAPRPEAAAAVRQLVRASHGCIGAESLAKSAGIARRAAAVIKRAELVEMERERKARCGRVRVIHPGVVRGFDAMHMHCVDGTYYWLIAADAAVPYRTSISTARRYDEASVIEALIADFEEHGPPLVIRLDRASCQRTPEVLATLNRYEVLALHGPPRHPQYYGQLERQNREHRDWLRLVSAMTGADLPDIAARMKTALNGLWARPTLGWCTAEQVWEARSTIAVDRSALRQDVERRTSDLAHRFGIDPLAARRRAIESALVERELLALNFGGQC
jgi:hypothetical protein